MRANIVGSVLLFLSASSASGQSPLHTHRLRAAAPTPEHGPVVAVVPQGLSLQPVLDTDVPGPDGWIPEPRPPGDIALGPDDVDAGWLAPVGAELDAVPQDTAAPGPFFIRRDAVIAGAFVAGAIVATRFDSRLATWLQTRRSHENSFVHNTAAAFRFLGEPAPEIIGVALYGIGRAAHARPVAALGLHGLEAIVLATGFTGVVKLAAGRARPYVSQDHSPNDFEFARGFKGHDYQSFPSGHATTAFAVASAVTAESKHFWPNHEYLVGTFMFTGAGLIGVSRLYHDQHWASDVITGAMIGTFSGFKVVEYDYRHPDNLLDRLLLGARVAPDENGRLYLSVTLGTGR